MTIAQALKIAKQRLNHLDNASIDAYALLSHILKCGRNDLIVHGEKILNNFTQSVFYF